MGLNLCQVWSPIWKRWVLSYIQSYILLLAIQLWHELFTNNNADQTGTVGSNLLINLIQHLGNTMFFFVPFLYIIKSFFKMSLERIKFINMMMQYYVLHIYSLSVFASRLSILTNNSCSFCFSSVKLFLKPFIWLYYKTKY